VSITPRKLKSGKTVYDVVVYIGFTPDGRRDRKAVTCRTKRAAEVEHAKLVAMADAMRGKSGRMALSEYIDSRWWPAVLRRLQATSLDTYEREVRLRIKPALGSMDLRDIDRPAVQRMVDNCETEAVARKSVGTLKTILNEAKSDGLIASNPAESTFTMPRKGCSRGSGLVLGSFGQILHMLDIVAYRASESVQRISYLGMLQGLRPEERYALDWSDVDVANRAIHVRTAYVMASPKHGGRQLKPPKTENGARDVPMLPQFADWLSTQARADGAFIVGADGQRISPSTAQKRWRAFLRDNPDVPPVTIENMRHSFATAYLAAGGRVEALSRILGHADISTTLRRYVRPDFGNLRQDVDALDLPANRFLTDGGGFPQVRPPGHGVRFSAPPPEI